eukprot:gene21689-26225_t
MELSDPQLRNQPKRRQTIPNTLRLCKEPTSTQSFAELDGMTTIHLRTAPLLSATAENTRQTSESCFNVNQYCLLPAHFKQNQNHFPLGLYLILKTMNRSFQLTSRILRSSAPLQRRMASTNANFVVLGDSDALKGIVESSESKVLYFTATWCPPCKMIAPVFEKLSKDFPTTKF